MTRRRMTTDSLAAFLDEVAQVAGARPGEVVVYTVTFRPTSAPGVVFVLNQRATVLPVPDGGES